MPDSSTDVILARINALSEDMGDMKSALKDMAAAFSKLALVEERQAYTNEALGRAFKAQEKLEERLRGIETRLSNIERDMPMQKQTSGWVMSGVWAAAGLTVLFVAKKAGLI